MPHGCRSRALNRGVRSKRQPFTQTNGPAYIFRSGSLGRTLGSVANRCPWTATGSVSTVSLDQPYLLLCRAWRSSQLWGPAQVRLSALPSRHLLVSSPPHRRWFLPTQVPFFSQSPFHLSSATFIRHRVFITLQPLHQLELAVPRHRKTKTFITRKNLTVDHIQHLPFYTTFNQGLKVN